MLPFKQLSSIISSFAINHNLLSLVRTTFTRPHIHIKTTPVVTNVLTHLLRLSPLFHLHSPPIPFGKWQGESWYVNVAYHSWCIILSFALCGISPYSLMDPTSTAIHVNAPMHTKICSAQNTTYAQEARYVGIANVSILVADMRLAPSVKWLCILANHQEAKSHAMMALMILLKRYKVLVLVVYHVVSWLIKQDGVINEIQRISSQQHVHIRKWGKMRSGENYREAIDVENTEVAKISGDHCGDNIEPTTVYTWCFPWLLSFASMGLSFGNVTYHVSLSIAWLLLTLGNPMLSDTIVYKESGSIKYLVISYDSRARNPNRSWCIETPFSEHSLQR